MNNSDVTSIPNAVIKPRIEYIDLLKVFLMFCVIWSHSIGDFRTNNDERFFLADPVLKFIFTFHMPLFFMISSFFLLHPWCYVLRKSSEKDLPH